MLKRILCAMLLVAAAALWKIGPADAAEDAIAPYADLDYGTGAGKKLGRGLSNAAFGWLEVPRAIEDIGDQHNFIAALTWGPIQGTGRAIHRTLAGVYEVATFPVPQPAHFEPLIQPEFVLTDTR